MKSIIRLLAAIAATSLSHAAAAQTAATPLERAAAARAAIVAGNKTWATARLAGDRATFERMLMPDFTAKLPNRTATRQEFLESIATTSGDARLVRFVPSVLTVVPVSDGGDAIIEEKLEIERTGPDGKKVRDFQLWITRDRWRQVDGAWKVLSSEALGMEWWRGAVPFADWN